MTQYIDVIAGVRFDRFDLKFTGFDPVRPTFRGQLRRVDNEVVATLRPCVKPIENCFALWFIFADLPAIGGRPVQRAVSDRRQSRAAGFREC